MQYVKVDFYMLECAAYFRTSFTCMIHAIKFQKLFRLSKIHEICKKYFEVSGKQYTGSLKRLTRV